MFPQAVEQYQKGIEVTGGKAFIPYSLLASAYADSGQTAKAEEKLEVMNKKFGEDQWISATVHAQMGQRELAIRELVEDVAKLRGRDLLPRRVTIGTTGEQWLPQNCSMKSLY